MKEAIFEEDIQKVKFFWVFLIYFYFYECWMYYYHVWVGKAI